MVKFRQSTPKRHLHSLRYSYVLYGFPVPTLLGSKDCSILDKGVEDLLNEERIPARVLVDQFRELRRNRMFPECCLDKLHRLWFFQVLHVDALQNAFSVQLQEDLLKRTLLSLLLRRGGANG